VPVPLIEFPADDPDRARRFWRGVLGAELTPRPIQAGSSQAAALAAPSSLRTTAGTTAPLSGSLREPKTPKARFGSGF
jgi:catechol 2,3-dioxygenase-like lactoylglutathione lyase family enzyme